MAWYVIDGMDGSGKSTAAGTLERILSEKGRRVRIYNHPNDECVFGRMSRRCLLKHGTPAKLFSAAFLICDIIHSLFSMKRSDCDDVIFTRYTMSACYLSSKVFVPVYDILTAILPRPDMGLLLDVTPETAFKRIHSRGENLEMFENMESLEKTRNKMLSVSDNWTITDAELTPREIEDVLRSIVKG
jgi:dTMP kinase